MKMGLTPSIVTLIGPEHQGKHKQRSEESDSATALLDVLKPPLRPRHAVIGQLREPAGEERAQDAPSRQGQDATRHEDFASVEAFGQQGQEELRPVLQHLTPTHASVGAGQACIGAVVPAADLVPSGLGDGGGEGRPAQACFLHYLAPLGRLLVVCVLGAGACCLALYVVVLVVQRDIAAAAAARQGRHFHSTTFLNSKS
mmetsp:Transcript_12153/g.27730  ORF Transcript_12153/g.27730 Transcript_12153/m.27730 type:complete len:200 (+) Transcript_12153:902-1501(+)